MPKALEQKLKREASKKFPGDEERRDAYVYGTLRKTGWTPSTQNQSNHPGNKVAWKPRGGRKS